MQTKLELIKHVQRNYPNLGPIKKITKLRHTDINTTIFLIDSSSGKYILRKFKTPNPQKMEKICEILHHCIKNNVKVMEPIRNKNKKFVDNSNQIFLTKYYEGKHFSGKKQEIVSIAKQIAILHKFLMICPISLSMKEKSNIYKIVKNSDLNKIENIIMKKKSKDVYDKLVISNIKLLTEIINQFEKNLQKTITPKQLIHFDLHPKNIIFYKGNISTILDFGTLMEGSIIDDVSFCSFRFAIEKSGKKNIEKLMNLFLIEYCKKSKIPVSNFLNFQLSLLKMILMRLSYILRNRYFKNSDEWISDLGKNLKFLKLITQLDFDKIIR